VTSNEEAFHGLLLYMDGSDPDATYEARVRDLKSRRLIPPDFKHGPNEAVSRGTLAVAMVGALHIKGGLMMHLVGPTPRYALRELEYRGLYPISSENQTFSGAEYLGIIGKMDDYQHTGAPPPVVVKRPATRPT